MVEMKMEGIYKDLGDWDYKVGIKGKRGVGGGIMEVVKGEMEIEEF